MLRKEVPSVAFSPRSRKARTLGPPSEDNVPCPKIGQGSPKASAGSKSSDKTVSNPVMALWPYGSDAGKYINEFQSSPMSMLSVDDTDYPSMTFNMSANLNAHLQTQKTSLTRAMVTYEQQQNDAGIESFDRENDTDYIALKEKADAWPITRAELKDIGLSYRLYAPPSPPLPNVPKFHPYTKTFHCDEGEDGAIDMLRFVDGFWNSRAESPEHKGKPKRTIQIHNFTAYDLSEFITHSQYKDYAIVQAAPPAGLQLFGPPPPEGLQVVNMTINNIEGGKITVVWTGRTYQYNQELTACGVAWGYLDQDGAAVQKGQGIYARYVADVPDTNTSVIDEIVSSGFLASPMFVRIKGKPTANTTSYINELRQKPQFFFL